MTLSGAAIAGSNSSETAGVGTETYEQGDLYTRDLIGMWNDNVETERETHARLSDGAESAWNNIGEIDDIMVCKDGDIRTVHLGVCGFLGSGDCR